MITKEEAKERLKVNVRKIRQMLGMTQVDLAELAGVEQGTISKLESGSVLPNVADMANIAEALNTTSEVLLKPVVPAEKVKV